MNSSPPIRTMTSCARMLRRTTSAKAVKNLSPILWPYKSLTSLKLSRSKMISMPARSEQSFVKRMVPAALFKKPVSLSTDASSFRSSSSWVCLTAFKMRRMRISLWTGLRIKSAAPCSKLRISASLVSMPLKKMMGVGLRPSFSSMRRNAWYVSKPSISGICISSRIKSGVFFPIYFKRSRPERRQVTRISCSRKMRFTYVSVMASSSTTTIQTPIVISLLPL